MAEFFSVTGDAVAAPLSAGAATDMNKAKAVRCSNITVGSFYIVYVVDENGTAIGNTYILPFQSAIINKRPTDKMYSNNASIIFTPVGYPRG